MNSNERSETDKDEDSIVRDICVSRVAPFGAGLQWLRLPAFEAKSRRLREIFGLQLGVRVCDGLRP